MHPKPISKYTIALDKLDLMLTHEHLLSTVFSNDLTALTRSTAQQSYTSGKTVLTKLTDIQNTDKNYHLAYAVEYDGITVGTVLTARTKFYLSDDSLVKFKVNNQLLYSNWSTTVQAVLTSLNLIIHNITYLELALDTNTNAQNLYYRYFRDKEKYQLVNGSRLVNKNKFIGEEDRDGEISRSIYLGKTDKQLVIYNKTLSIAADLKKGIDKSYITDYHGANGLDITSDIYRIELKLKNTALKRYETKYEYQPNATEQPISEYQYKKLTPIGKDSYYPLSNGTVVDLRRNPIDMEYYNSLSNKGQQNYKKITISSKIPLTLSNLADTDYLLALYAELFIIDFRLRDGSGNIKRCTSVPFINFTTITNIIKNQTMKLVPSRDNNKLKELIKMNLRQYKLLNLDTIKQCTLAIAKQHKLEDYFDMVLNELDGKPAYKTAPMVTASNSFTFNSL